MIKNLNKFKTVYLSITGILFLLLAISTFVKDGLYEDYMFFQMFRSSLYGNRVNFIELSTNNSYYSQMEDTINTLDLDYHIFRESILFSDTIFQNKKFSEDFEEFDMIWTRFISSILSRSGDLNREEADNNLQEMLLLLDTINDHVSTNQNIWSLYYNILISLNILIFMFIITLFYVINGDPKGQESTISSVRNALIEGQEQERLRISLELHDKVAQDLFACKMILKDLSKACEKEELSVTVSRSLSLLDTSIKEVRDLSYTLRPPALQSIGLESAIQSYVDNISGKIDIPITFKAVGVNNKNIKESISINLYRILQETLNNVAKHAHAKNIDIKLIYTYPYLLLKIEDDGVGFKYVKSEFKAKGRNQLGLPGINERVSLLGGELIINTEKGEGTKILIKVPVAANEKV